MESVLPGPGPRGLAILPHGRAPAPAVESTLCMLNTRRLEAGGMSQKACGSLDPMTPTCIIRGMVPQRLVDGKAQLLCPRLCPLGLL